MPRIPRPDLSHSIVHVISRGVDRRDIFTNDGDWRFFLCCMREAFRLVSIRVIAYCLMGNHFHLLLAFGPGGYVAGLHRLLLRYATYFNHRQERSGHLFQARYKSFIVRSTKRLFHLVDYIHANPVAAGIVDDPAKWPWSSHHELLSGKHKIIDLSTLEELTGVTPEELRAGYQSMLDERQDLGLPRKTLEALFERAADIAGLPVDELHEGGRNEQAGKGRAIFINSAFQAGYKAREIARALGCSEAAVSQRKKNLSQVPVP